MSVPFRANHKSLAVAIKKAFMTPTVKQVADYMNLRRPDWPTNFIAYYSQKFMHHYVANGWLVGRVKMKSWESTISCQWLELKYKEDKDRLDAELKSWTHKVMLDEKKRKSAGLFAVAEGPGPSPFDRWLEQMDAIYAAWMVGNAKDSQLREVGDWLRSEKLLLLPKVQQEQIIADAGNNGDLRVLLAIRQFFCNLKAKDLTPSSFVRSRIETQKIKTA
jgi:hypothetical protein